MAAERFLVVLCSNLDGDDRLIEVSGACQLLDRASQGHDIHSPECVAKR